MVPGVRKWGAGGLDMEREGDECDYKGVARGMFVVMEQVCSLWGGLYKSTHDKIAQTFRHKCI